MQRGALLFQPKAFYMCILWIYVLLESIFYIFWKVILIVSSYLNKYYVNIYFLVKTLRVDCMIQKFRLKLFEVFLSTSPKKCYWLRNLKIFRMKNKVVKSDLQLHLKKLATSKVSIFLGFKIFLLLLYSQRGKPIILWQLICFFYFSNSAEIFFANVLGLLSP